MARFQYVAYQRRFLLLVDNEFRLLDFLRGARHGNGHLCRVAEYLLGHLLDASWHCGGEHKGLAVGRQKLYNLHDVVVETHVEHPVGLVEDEIRHFREVDVAHLYMCYEAAGGGDDHIGSEFQCFLLPGECGAVGAAVDCHRGQGQIVGESFHLAVNLLGELAGGSHHDAVHRFLRFGQAVQAVDYREEVCGGLAGAGLGAGNGVVAVEDDVDSLFLNRSALLEVHGIEGVRGVKCREKFVTLPLDKPRL